MPEGWATAEGGSFVYRESSERPRDRYAGPGGVLLTYWTVSHVYTDACHHEATLVDAGTTTDELASLLVAQKGRVASAATDVTLGGFPAKRIELTVPADLDVTKCDGGFIRFWPDAGPDESGGLCCTDVGSTDVVYVVDVAGNRFAVVARHQASSSAEELAELEAIVASIMIEPPATSPSPSGASPSSSIGHTTQGTLQFGELLVVGANTPLTNVNKATAFEHRLFLVTRRHSSVVEQLFRKQQVLGSNPSVGSTSPSTIQVLFGPP